MSKKFIQDNYIVRYLSDPFIFISLIGPSLMDLNYLYIEHFTIKNQMLNKFQELFNEPMTYALVSHNTQLFVLILAIVFMFSESFGTYNKARGISVDDVPNYPSVHLNICLIFFFVIIGGFILGFFHGEFSDPQYVALYSKKQWIPPLSSPITWCRIAIWLYGALYSYTKGRIIIEDKIKID